MRGQFWFCFLKWELNFGFVFWDKRLILVFWDERSILLVAIWSDSPRRGCQVSAKESHLRESLQISLSPSGSDPSLNDASLMTRPAPHFLEVTFLPHFPRKSADGEEPTNCDVYESQWCGFMPPALFGLCWPQPIRRWLWWCKLYFSDSKSAFLRWCISQILQAVHISQIMPSLASLVSADHSLLGDQLLLQLQTKVYDQPNNLWPERYCCQP